MFGPSHQAFKKVGLKPLVVGKTLEKFQGNPCRAGGRRDFSGRLFRHRTSFSFAAARPTPNEIRSALRDSSIPHSSCALIRTMTTFHTPARAWASKETKRSGAVDSVRPTNL